MMNALAAAFPVVRDTFAEASAALGFDLAALVAQGPEERLNETTVTQPAMLAAGVATWRAWRAQGGPEPAIMAGHSLGEYSALVAAEALGFADAVRLVADRARFMQEAVPIGQGAMAAILGLDDDAVRAVCEGAAQGQIVSAVNFNSPGQVVIAGETAAVARAIEAAKVAGAKRAMTLPVSVPSHCALMHPAAERLAVRLAETRVQAPRIPVLHNVNVQTETTPDGVRAALARQVEAPVRWVESVSRMASSGARIAIECGPGKVLAGLNKRISRDMNTIAVYDPATLEQALAAVREMTGG